MKTLRSILEALLLHEDRIAFCFDHGLLNLSAFAKQIEAQVQTELGQSVATNTIVAALSRLQKSREAPSESPIELHASDLSVKTGLSSIAYEKTAKVQALLSKVVAQTQLTRSDLFALAIGLSQISLVVPQEQVAALRKELKAIKPLYTSDNLASVTVRFGPKYLKTPGVVHHFIKSIASRGVNIVEVVSTFTELTVIVIDADLEAAFLAWHRCIADDKDTRAAV
jgi:aspartokinase